MGARRGHVEQCGERSKKYEYSRNAASQRRVHEVSLLGCRMRFDEVLDGNEGQTAGGGRVKRANVAKALRRIDGGRAIWSAMTEVVGAQTAADTV